MSEINFEDDVILPEGFDPNDKDFTLADWDKPAEEAPTTETETAAPEQTETVTEQTTAEAPETTVSEEATVEPTTVPQTVKVKYNHEERELSLDEAATYAQKGMNYDKLEEKIKNFEAENAKALDLATRLGYSSVSEMHDAAANNLFKRKVRELVDAGNTQAMAEFLVKQEMNQALTLAPKETKPQEEPTPEPSKPNIPAERKAELEEFVKAYPGVTKLPDEVIAANRAGTRLLVAYERHLNQATQKENAILKQNQAAAAKAPVTGVTGRPSTAESKSVDDDPFMKGFNNDKW